MTSLATTLQEHRRVIKALLHQGEAIEKAGALLSRCLDAGNKILLCGNGGSAADCQHMATELMVRYRNRRHPLSAVALTTDTSVLTAHSNDFGFDTVFSRQLEGIGAAGDCLLAISTSGTSINIIRAVETARMMNIHTIGLTGSSGHELARLAELAVIVPSSVTARIQEAHILIIHWWCELLEKKAQGKGR